MRHKRNIICFILICIFAMNLSAAVAADETQQMDLTVTSGCHSEDAAIPFLGQSKLIDNAQAIFLFETKSDTLMYAWNADTQIYPASLVKIMTGLLVAELGNFEDVATVSEAAVNSIPGDAITIGLRKGEQITVKDLFYSMIVTSANDSAAVLAEHICGSQVEFVNLMNKRAAELGCTGTNFTNVHGLHNDAQLTTARDVGKMLNQALKSDVFRDAFGTVYYTVQPTNLHDVRNISTNNYLMNMDDVGIHFDGRVTGGRTGVTSDGYRSVASVSQSGNMELICVVLGSASSFEDDSYNVKSFGGFPETSKLLDIAYSGYSRRQIIFENQILRQQSVLNGENDVFVASYESFSTVLPSDVSFDQLTYLYTDVPGSEAAPIQKGENVSSLQIWYGSVCIAETDAFAMNDVPVMQDKIVKAESEENDSSILRLFIIIFIVFVVLAVAVLILLRIRSELRHRSKRTGKRNRKEM